MSYMDTLRDRAKMLREWRVWATRVAVAVKENLPGAQVYVIGSVVRGDHTGGSDIDILILSDALPNKSIERAQLKVKIEEAAKLPLSHPFQFHLATPPEAEAYFRMSGKSALKL